MNMKAKFCFLVLNIMILKWVSATSRNLAPNNDLGPVISPSLQKGLSNYRAKTEEGLINEEGLYKRVIGNNRAKAELLYKRVMGKIGSSPPSCEHKCYGCTPCEAIQVPTTTTSTKVGVQYTNYEPEGWKCKCGPFFYSP